MPREKEGPERVKENLCCLLKVNSLSVARMNPLFAILLLVALGGWVPAYSVQPAEEHVPPPILTVCVSRLWDAVMASGRIVIHPPSHRQQ